MSDTKTTAGLLEQLAEKVQALDPSIKTTIRGDMLLAHFDGETHPYSFDIASVERVGVQKAAAMVDMTARMQAASRAWRAATQPTG